MYSRSESTPFQPVLRFVIEDEKRKIFYAEKFCFLGGIDDRMHISGPDSLEKLAKTFIKHLESESFLELYE